jgi:hypothetical protein
MSDYTNTNGKFKPGNPGRPVGAVSKFTAKARSNIESILSGDLKQAKEDFKELSAFQRWKVRLALYEYYFPKMRSVEFSGEVDMIDRLTDEQAKSVSQDITRKVIEKLYEDKLPEGKDGL